MTQAAISGYNTNLPADILQDTGVLYVGASPGAVLFATRGGIQWDPQAEMRNVPYDGQKSKVAGLDRYVMRGGVLKGTAIQLGPEILRKLEAASTQTGHDPQTAPTDVAVITPAQAGVFLAALGDYQANVRCLWSRSGGGFFEVTLMYGVVTKWDIKGKDKEEAEISFEIEARRDPSVAEAVAPYKYRYIPVVAS